MGDVELRRLERRWKQTGAAADKLAYDTARRRHGRGGMVFVYRCHYEGPLGLRIVRLPDASSRRGRRSGRSAADATSTRTTS